MKNTLFGKQMEIKNKIKILDCAVKSKVFKKKQQNPQDQKS